MRKLFFILLWALTGTALLQAQDAAVVSVKASSFEPGNNPENVIDDNDKSRWSSQFSDPQWIELELAKNTVIDGVVLKWESACAKTYQIQVSQDETNWFVVYSTDNGHEGEVQIPFKPVSARFVRMFGLERKTGWGYSIFRFTARESKSPSAGFDSYPRFDAVSLLKLIPESPKTYYNLVALLSKESYYPLWMSKKQDYFTVVGSDSGFIESAVSEDGMVDAGNKKFSVIPYFYIDNELLAVSDFHPECTLQDNYLPIPVLTGTKGDLSLKQTVFVRGETGNDRTIVMISLKNNGTKAAQGKLFLTLRPFEVNPTWMNGGMVDLFSLFVTNKKTVIVNGRDSLGCGDFPDGAGFLSYQQGDIMNYIRKGELPVFQDAFDPLGGANGALKFGFTIQPGEEKVFSYSIPLDRKPDPGIVVPLNPQKSLEETSGFWRSKLDKIAVNAPDHYLFDVMRSSIAYILVNKDGPAFQGGSRNYERTWIRDGAEIASALLRMGFTDEVRDYINWVCDHQLLPCGEVLPMINADGSSWEWGKTLNEFDGQGCFIYLISEYYRFTHDRKFLEDKFPAIMQAFNYIRFLRSQELRDELKNGTAEKRRDYGILPISVSHEGYSAPGQHSYWDDFWALKGLKDAGAMARVLGKKEESDQIKAEETGLRKCLLDSIKYAQEAGKFDFIPGCADLGDFDACSLAVSVWPTDEAKYLSEPVVLKNLDKWYNEVFLPVRMDGVKKIDMLPYEMRIARAYLLLGEKEKGLAILNYNLGLTRPRGWNQWAEVVRYNYRDPGYLGDMPHTWVAATFLTCARSLFVIEKEGALVLAAGVDEKDLTTGGGVSIKKFPTYYGEINYTLKQEKDGIKFEASGTANPEKGFVLRSPYLKKQVKSVSINGKDSQDFKGLDIYFHELPARIVINY